MTELSGKQEGSGALAPIVGSRVCYSLFPTYYSLHLHVLHGLGEVGECGFGVAVEHVGAGLEEERILEA